MRVQSAPKILKKAPEKDEDEIDPLEYFKTEHIKIEPSDMKEYATKEELEEEEKAKEVHKNINEVIIDTKTGMMGPTSHKINFMEMMKSRNKVKKTNEPIN